MSLENWTGKNDKALKCIFCGSSELKFLDTGKIKCLTCKRRMMQSEE